MKSLTQKKTISIGSSTLEYGTSGTGSPAIVLINGSGVPIEGWYRVFAELETLSTVLVYNRLGIGKSSKPKEPQTGAVMVETLRELLLKAGLPPTYLLVGHSLGGLIANLFVRCYPEEIRGVVFLDATAPEDIAMMAAHETALMRFLQRTLDAIHGKDSLGEITHATRTSELISLAPAFPDIPLIVVTGGKPAMSWLISAPALAERAEHQRRMAVLSPRGKQIIAKRSGHFPQFTEPGVVVQAVREALALGRIAHA